MTGVYSISTRNASNFCWNNSHSEVHTVNVFVEFYEVEYLIKMLHQKNAFAIGKTTAKKFAAKKMSHKNINFWRYIFTRKYCTRRKLMEETLHIQHYKIIWASWYPHNAATKQRLSDFSCAKYDKNLLYLPPKIHLQVCSLTALVFFVYFFSDTVDKTRHIVYLLIHSKGDSFSCLQSSRKKRKKEHDIRRKYFHMH